MKRFWEHHAKTIRRWLTHPHVPIIMACVGIMLSLPALDTGLVADDYIHRAKLLGQWLSPDTDASLWGLFSFIEGTPEQVLTFKETGFGPWWMFEEFPARITFWRPLTEVTHWIDYQLWPETPWLMHLHSLLWFGAAIWVIASLYQKIIGPVWVAGLASVLFAISNNHAVAAGLLCQRNTLIAAFFGSLGFWAHIRWRREGWHPGILWGSVCYLLALFSKEAALAFGAYLFAYTLFLDCGTLRQKVVGFLPYFAITFGWYAVYRHLGFGAEGIPEVYIDPGNSPFLFLKALLIRMPALLLAQFTGLLADLWSFVGFILSESVLIWGAVVATALLIIMLVILLPLFKRDAVTRFWGIGMLLGLVPSCIVFPSSRLLFFSTIGAMGIIARFLASWSEHAADRQFRTRPAHLLSVAFIMIHLILSPVVVQLVHAGLGSANRRGHEIVSSMPYDDDIPQKSVVVVNPPVEPVLLGGISFIRAAYGYPVPAHVWSLASGELPLTITRIDERTIDIESQQGLLDTPFGKLLRGQSHPMHVGQQIELSELSVEVLVLADDWQPSRARFTFAVPLEDPSLVWFQVKDWKLLPYTPLAIGESEVLSELDPWKPWETSLVLKAEAILKSVKDR